MTPYAVARSMCCYKFIPSLHQFV